MILTRDKSKSGMLCIWQTEDSESIVLDSGHIWISSTINEIVFHPKEFKQLFPGEKLPRKGSKQYINHLKIVRG